MRMEISEDFIKNFRSTKVGWYILGRVSTLFGLLTEHLTHKLLRE